jgi:hypothetical protein
VKDVTLLVARSSLHLQVDLQRSMKVGERRFIRDYFDLAGNACASLYDNVLALTSVSF